MRVADEWTETSASSTARGRLGVAGAEEVGGVGDGEAHPPAAHRVVDEAVLHRLEPTDHLAERLAFGGVGDRAIEHALHPSE